MYLNKIVYHAYSKLLSNFELSGKKYSPPTNNKTWFCNSYPLRHAKDFIIKPNASIEPIFLPSSNTWVSPFWLQSCSYIHFTLLITFAGNIFYDCFSFLLTNDPPIKFFMFLSLVSSWNTGNDNISLVVA